MDIDAVVTVSIEPMLPVELGWCNPVSATDTGPAGRVHSPMQQPCQWARLSGFLTILIKN
jgi:hypothetical protein